MKGTSVAAQGKNVEAILKTPKTKMTYTISAGSVSKEVGSPELWKAISQAELASSTSGLAKGLKSKAYLAILNEAKAVPVIAEFKPFVKLIVQKPNLKKALLQALKLDSYQSAAESVVEKIIMDELKKMVTSVLSDSSVAKESIKNTTVKADSNGENGALISTPIKLNDDLSVIAHYFLDGKNLALVGLEIGVPKVEEKKQEENTKEIISGYVCNTGFPPLLASSQSKAQLETKSGNYESALKILNEAIISESHPALYNDRAVVFSLMKKYEEALKDVNKAIELDPKCPNHYFTRSGIYSDMGDFDNAVQDASRAHEMDPNDKIFKDRLEITKEDLEKSKEAGLISEQNKYNNKGLGALDKAKKTKNPNKAIQFCTKATENLQKALDIAMELSPSSNDTTTIKENLATAYNNRGLAHLDLGDIYNNKSKNYDKALEEYNNGKKDLEKAKKLSPKDKTILENLKDADSKISSISKKKSEETEEKEKPEKTKEDELISERDKYNKKGLGALSKAEKTKDPNKAIQFCTEATENLQKALDIAMELSPSSNDTTTIKENLATAYNNRGLAHLDLGDIYNNKSKNYDKALEEYNNGKKDLEKAKKLSPKDKTILENLKNADSRISSISKKKSEETEEEEKPEKTKEDELISERDKYDDKGLGALDKAKKTKNPNKAIATFHRQSHHLAPLAA